MISIEKIADYLTHYIVRNNVIKAEDSEIYKYGFLTGIELLICIVVCYGIAIKLEMTIECTIFFLIFFSLRSFVGGIHMNSYRNCFFCSCIMVFFNLLAIKNTNLQVEWALIIICCEILIILFLKPIENKNRPVDKNEQRIFSHKIKQNLAMVLGSTVVFYVASYNNYLRVITYALGTIIISMFLGRRGKKEERGGEEFSNK